MWTFTLSSRLIGPSLQAHGKHGALNDSIVSSMYDGMVPVKTKRRGISVWTWCITICPQPTKQQQVESVRPIAEDKTTS